MELVTKAEAFARLKHATQVRKYDGQPYIVHPVAVKDILMNVGYNHEGTQNLLATALLHDTVEDTNTTIQEILEEFNETVAESVFWLTDYKHACEGNRATRKLITRWKLSRAPMSAKLVKIADLIDNTKDIEKGDPSFAVVYRKEKRDLLDAIEESIDFEADRYGHSAELIEMARKGL